MKHSINIVDYLESGLYDFPAAASRRAYVGDCAHVDRAHHKLLDSYYCGGDWTEYWFTMYLPALL